jgi:tight adherence protein C
MMSFELGSLIGMDGLLPLMAVGGLLIIGLALIWSGAKDRPCSITQRIDKLNGEPGKAGGKAGNAKRRPSGQRIDPEATRPLTEAEHRQLIRSLARFGVRPESALAWFKASRLLLPVVLAMATLPLTMGLMSRSPAAALLVMAVPGAIGYMAPMILLRRAMRRHCKAVVAGLSDALELLAVCMEAGLSLENGLQRVSTELKRSLPELADELALTWAEINILPDRDQALINFADRVDMPSVRTVVTTLAQTLRYGTPLTRSLRVVAADVRGDQLTKMEEKANRLPALMTIPVMLFIMPTIFLIIGGPAALKLMDIMWGK